jgi:hypothetical protein
MASGLLSEEGKERLAQTCRTTIGDSLRSMTYFTTSDYEQVYLRSDLSRDADLEQFVGTEWHDYNVTQDAYSGTELGAYRYTIRVFENGYLVRITTDDSGVFVTTDGLTMQDFEALARAVEEVLKTWDTDE